MSRLPWPKVITPRPELWQADGTDPEAFTVRLEELVQGGAEAGLAPPERFFAQTFFATPLTELAIGVVRRLARERNAAPAVFRVAGAAGAGKTHALALLAHLARGGPAAEAWAGVRTLLSRAGVGRMPAASVVLLKLGGSGPGQPSRAPWQSLAEQLGEADGASSPAIPPRAGEVPGTEQLRGLLNRQRPTLILIDEAYDDRTDADDGSDPQERAEAEFLERLIESVSLSSGCALVIAGPDGAEQSDADRASAEVPSPRPGEASIRTLTLNAEQHIAEIVRCRFFESEPRVAHLDLAGGYADWLRHQARRLPAWFRQDSAAFLFASAFPFHPAILLLLRRKWWHLPDFPHTRGILGLLAPWAGHGLRRQVTGTLIGLGDAPLEVERFRGLVCEQLGDPGLEQIITTDIAGAPGSIAEQMDAGRRGSLYRRLATAVFLESCGGRRQTFASRAELCLALGAPGLNPERLDQGLRDLGSACHYLRCDPEQCRFIPIPDLDRVHAQRSTQLDAEKVAQRARQEVRRVLEPGRGPTRAWFPERSTQIPDRAVLTLGILSPADSLEDAHTLDLLERLTLEYGPFRRIFRNGVVWLATESARRLYQAVRGLMAWEALGQESTPEDLRDEARQQRLTERLAAAQRQVTESVWAAYQHAVVLGEDNRIRGVELGPFLSDGEGCLMDAVIDGLIRRGELAAQLGPEELLRYWPPGKDKWSTRALRDMFYMSAAFPRIVAPSVLRAMIARGVGEGLLAYQPVGEEQQLVAGEPLTEAQVEFGEETFIVTAQEARRRLSMPALKSIEILPPAASMVAGAGLRFLAVGRDQHGRYFPLQGVDWGASCGEIDADGRFRAPRRAADCFVTAAVSGIAAAVPVKIGGTDRAGREPGAETGTSTWSGEVPTEHWAVFAEQVLIPLDEVGGLKVRVSIEAGGEGESSSAQGDSSEPATSAPRGRE